MIWSILLAALGVPIWLIVGVLASAAISRRRFQRSERVFPLRMRDPENSKWGRKNHGRWVQSVLLVNTGFALVRTEPFDVGSLSLDADDVAPTKGPCDDRVVYSLGVDHESTLLMAIDAEYADLAMGPFNTT